MINIYLVLEFVLRRILLSNEEYLENRIYVFQISLYDVKLNKYNAWTGEITFIWVGEMIICGAG